MPRPMRVELAGTIYHLMSRGNRREPIFFDNEDRQTFLRTLGEACETTVWQVHAYCLTGTHFHPKFRRTLMNGSQGKPHELLERLGVHRVGYVHFTDTDGTLFHGTSKHLPAGEGHIDVRRALEVLWNGGYEGWLMIDPWMTPDPYVACRKGKQAIENARRDFNLKD